MYFTYVFPLLKFTIKNINHSFLGKNLPDSSHEIPSWEVTHHTNHTVAPPEVAAYLVQSDSNAWQQPYLDVPGRKLGSIWLGSMGDFTPRNIPFISIYK